VVLNRVNAQSYFGRCIPEVMLKPGHFSSINQNGTNRTHLGFVPPMTASSLSARPLRSLRRMATSKPILQAAPPTSTESTGSLPELPG
jgi:hypothetical protein